MRVLFRSSHSAVRCRFLCHRAWLGARLLADIRLAEIPENMIDNPGLNQADTPLKVGAALRRRTRAVAVQWGGRVVQVGANAPVVVQSMTNTDTADAIATAIQVKELAQAGSELVRITVNTPEAARQVPAIRQQLDESDERREGKEE